MTGTSAQLRARTPRGARMIARLVGLLALGTLAALCVPWQQSTRAAGTLTAWDPNDRTQVVDATVEGRVVRVLVREGTDVREGDVLMELADVDPAYASRLGSEADALRQRVQSARAAVLEMEGRILDLQEARSRAIAAAEARTQATSDRRIAADQRVIEAEAQLARDRLQLTRREKGVAQGVASDRDLEVAVADARRSEAALEQARAAADAAGADEAAARAERARVETEANANVAQARATRDGAEMSEQSAVADLTRAEVRVSRQETQLVRAPRDGKVLRVLANPGSQLLKPGDALVELVPDTTERVVELRVDGRDQPLLAEGSQVRVQFEGWPALQFVGIPGLTTGTFPGVVALVDPAADATSGTVRILVSPDPAGAPWPDTGRLRQGARAVGWVLLGQVPLAKELWRQVNGFPPDRSPAAKGSTTGKAGAK